jgi:hypothetical protein
MRAPVDSLTKLLVKYELGSMQEDVKRESDGEVVLEPRPLLFSRNFYELMDNNSPRRFKWFMVLWKLA